MRGKVYQIKDGSELGDLYKVKNEYLHGFILGKRYTIGFIKNKIYIRLSGGGFIFLKNEFKIITAFEKNEVTKIERGLLIERWH